jgi:hypothetical protein
MDGMTATHRPTHSQKRPDLSALLLMLTYIQSECRALGAAESAHHVEMAATLLETLPPTGDEPEWAQALDKTVGHA